MNGRRRLVIPVTSTALLVALTVVMLTTRVVDLEFVFLGALLFAVPMLWADYVKHPRHCDSAERLKVEQRRQARRSGVR